MNLWMYPIAIGSTGQLNGEAEAINTAEGKLDRRQGQRQLLASFLWGRVDRGSLTPPSLCEQLVQRAHA